MCPPSPSKKTPHIRGLRNRQRRRDRFLAGRMYMRWYADHIDHGTFEAAATLNELHELESLGPPGN